MKQTALLIILLFSSLLSFAQSDESNRLFAEGVALYNAKKYLEAISVFEKVDSIDKAELDTLSSRANYANQWLASCYYKMGNEQKAREIDKWYYSLPPVDRNLTLASDGYFDKGQKNIEKQNWRMADFYLSLCADEEKMALGEHHYFLGNTYNNLSIVNYRQEKFQESYKYQLLALDCMKEYRDVAPFVYYKTLCAVADLLYNTSEVMQPSDAERLTDFVEDFYNAYRKLYAAEMMSDDDLAYMATCYINLFVAFNDDFEKILGNVKAVEDILDEKAPTNLNYAYMLIEKSKLISKQMRCYDSNEQILKALEKVSGLDKDTIPMFLYEAYNVLSNNFAQMADGRKGLEYTEKCEHIAKKYWPANEKNYQINLHRLYGMHYRSLKEAEKAEEHFNIAMKAMRDIGKEETDDYWNLKHDLALLYFIQNDTERYSNIMMDMAEKFRAEGNAAFECDIYNAMSDDYSNQNNYAEAAKYAKMAMDAVKGVAGMEVREISAMTRLARFYSAAMEMEKAIEMFKDLSQRYYEMAGRKDLNYATYLEMLCIAYFNTDNNEEAWTALQEAIQIRKEQSHNQREYFFILTYAASTLANYSMYDEAWSMLAKAEELKGEFGEGSMENYHLQTIIATIRMCEQNFDEALSVADNTIEKFKNASFLTVDLEYNLLDVKAAAHTNLNQPGKAVETYKRMLELERSKALPQGDRIITICMSLYNNYDLIGDIQNVEHYLTLCVDLINRQMGEFSPMAGVYVNLAKTRLLILKGKLADAEELLLEQLAKFENSSMNNNYYAENMIRVNLAKINIYQGKLQEALNHVDVILSPRTTAPANKILVDAARLYSAFAYTLLDQPYKALEQIEITLADPTVSHTYKRDANILRLEVLRRIGLDEKYTGEIISMVGKIKETLFNNFSTMTSQERFFQWNQLYQNIFLQFIPDICSNDTENKLLRELTYNSALFARGILLETDRNIGEMIASSGNESLKSLYRQHMANRQRLNELSRNLYNGTGMKNDEELQKAAVQLRQLAEQIEKDERRVNESVRSELGDFMKPLRTEWIDVKKSLGQEDIAIEMLEYVAEYKLRYAAMTIAADYDSPKFIPLFDREITDSLYFDNCYNDAKLSEQIWGKLHDELRGKQNIYFSLQGQLNSIALESLPRPDGAEGPVSSDGRKYYRLSSTRELALKDKNHQWGNSAAVYGGISYDADIEVIQKDMKHYARGKKATSSKAGRRPSAKTTTTTLKRDIAAIEYLPGTEAEAADIAKIINNADGNKSARLLLGTKGTEASFKAMVEEGRRIMHIGTHGYYIPTTGETQEDPFTAMLQNMTSLQENDQRSMEDRMLQRSGLLMAGALNRIYQEDFPEDVDDGILSAEEIATLNLSKTELITLSACDTGRGDITGDGVFGLQRGFKKAGAHSLLMSLWKVDDDATQLLMTEFYTNWRINKQTKYDAFESAKAKVRSTPGFESPEYWAAFILLDALD